MASIDVEQVLSKLTDAEKIELLAGIDFWHTAPNHDHGIPSLRFSDGPNGVRGTTFFNGKPSACFPCGTGLGATWNTELLEEAGALMGDEAIAKSAHVILGPCINMQRSPLGGRGFESISEDPVLAGYGASSLVAGIQSKGVVATIKHFVCNDQEHERMAYSAEISERALREIYLLPFQLAVRDSRPKAFMTAYNRVNGLHLSENPKILKDILRSEWGFKGAIMSDWFGTYSTSESINAGLDIEMPGPTRWRGGLVSHAITAMKISPETLDERARAVLNLVKDCAASGVPENGEEGDCNTPETASFLRRAATESIVLMKNDKQLLPLKAEKSTLIIGPNAKTAMYCGGGSSSMAAYYAISPHDGITKKLKGEVSYTIGCHAHKELPTLGSVLRTKDGKPGMTMKVYNDPPSKKDRICVDEINVTNTYMLLFDYKCAKIPDMQGVWYATIEGELTAENDGGYQLGLCVNGTADLYVDDHLLIDNTTKQVQGSMFFGSGTVEESGSFGVKKGEKYQIRVEFGSGRTSKLLSKGVVVFGGGGVRIGGCEQIDGAEEVKHAAELAKKVDQVVICAGLNQDWEGEGADRENMSLPGHMDELISSVAAANPSTVVVMQSGTPVEMPWISSVPALVQAWYGGNECGNAIADILFGDATPSGKLSLSFPIRVEDNPAYLNYTSQRGKTLYGEDVYIGYRYYEAQHKPVLFPFGHGLSYTTFAFARLHIADTTADDVTVTFTVTNTGSVAGAQVAQVYISQDQPSIARPAKELKGFKKVFLQPGESREVRVVLATKYACAFWDTGRDAWAVEKGRYTVLVSDSSAVDEAKALRGGFEVQETRYWRGI